MGGRLDPRGVEETEAMRRMQARVAAAARFDGGPPTGEVVAGIDVAFPRERPAIGAGVVVRGDAWVERTYVVREAPLPYIPGLLAFREGAIALETIDALWTPVDVTLLDGNGRLHPRQAGLATHVGVVIDRPTVGVAKSLLCGRPASPIDDLEAGERVPILADDAVAAPTGTVLGYAVQTRQFASPDRHVNPLFVSPGHRIDADAAVDVVMASCAGFKLPEPVRAADRYAARVVDRLSGRSQP